ncbi:MAG TPA: hypothetical protein VFD67_16235 [Gemmatimonadaceae bacterium]|nr:hypothetical protein [Gemmatimonadaceae bacterium]
MELLRLRDVPASPHDRVYRYSRGRAFVAYGLWWVGCAALFVTGIRQHAYVLDVAALLVAAGLLLARRFVVARFRDSNWLVRANENGLYIQFRSYLNCHFPADDCTVAFIPYREIRVARASRERQELPELSRNDRTVSIRTLQLVELDLTCDAVALGQALEAENTRPAPRRAAWYGSTGVKFQHHPVALDGTACLRLTWECVPSTRVLLDDLRHWVRVGASTSSTKSFTDLASVGRADQEQRIAALARVGQYVYAIGLARKLYGYDLRKARAYVEGLVAHERRSA